MGPTNIARISLIYLTDENVMNNVKNKLKSMSIKLGLPGASNKAAEIILN